MKRGKSYIESTKLIDATKLYDVEEAMEAVTKAARAKFDETVEVHVKLGVDSRHADQQVRGAVVLPHGTGKTTRVLVFAKEFNERTKNDIGYIIPVVITVYADHSFTFVTKTPPAAVLIKKAAGIESGSGVPNKTKVASLTKEQVKKIAEQKMPDLNAVDIEAAMSMIAGTARSMGVTVGE